jgi:hypothetical protein
MKAVPPSAAAPQYSAADIVQILERAKALGVRQLKLEGFEASWDIPQLPPVSAAAPPMVDDGAAGGYRAPAAAPPPPRADGPRENVRLVKEWCPDCRSQMELGRWDKPYCKRCYMEKKDRERQSYGGGRR